MDNCLVLLCIEAATKSRDAVETWRRQRRTLERMPSQLADALLHRLLRRRLLYPSLLEVFKYSIEEINLRGENSVDAEWLAYIGAFHYLRSLNLADCHRINNSGLWSLTGMTCLKEMNLSRCSKVTDAGVTHLLSIPTLEKIWLSETGVTTEGVKLLSSLPKLSVLDLGGLPVTDQALSSLQVLRKLRYLDLWGSQISNKGAAALKVFPKLSFLNLAWTKVTMLPNLSSLACLNMSNCSIHSIFEGHGANALLTKLILSGVTYMDVSEAFLFVETSFITFLDVSNSSLGRFCFLTHMNALEHLDLSSSSMGDDSIELIAGIGTNLRNLNLSKTKVSSSGVGILAGSVPNLEIISLSCTLIDDLAIHYLSIMPSLKAINLSSTIVKGLMHQLDAEPEWIPSLSALQGLKYLERLDLEDTQVRDAALYPLANFQDLSSLSIRSEFLTDACLYHLSSVPKLTNLSIRDAVFTGSGLGLFNPPATLKTLDLKGCWLLTEKDLSSFCKKYPRIETRHELIRNLQTDQEGPSYSSPSRATLRTSLVKKKPERFPPSPFISPNDTFIDQRLRYSRDELLALQFSSQSSISSSDRGKQIPE